LDQLKRFDRLEAINFDNFKKLSALYYKLDVISLNIYAVFKVLTHSANKQTSHAFSLFCCLKC
ncbi:hypothetical protein KLN45_20565, partial [Clostridioides difficile]|uniref:hypothetical protein n=1 Tax=Clostridioides difficile TaxID=1496 RepID=UPI001A9A33F8